MQGKVTRDQVFEWLKLFGEPLSQKDRHEGGIIIARYIGQVEHEIDRLKGAVRSPTMSKHFSESTYKRNMEILEMRIKGYTYSQIGRHFGLSPQRICQLVRKGAALGLCSQEDLPVGCMKWSDQPFTPQTSEVTR